MTTSAATPKDIQKLQRVIVDALEDVKAQDIVVFNTEHLSPLFERVIIATGTSNRQTKSLASSVRDKVREAGLPKPRLEGEDNGEWIIVDCGPAVVHIMQQAIRQYYHLEEIWGDKPVRLKLGAPKPATPVAVKATPVKTKSKAAATKASPAKKAPLKGTPRASAPSKSAAAPAKKTTPKKPIQATGRPKTKAS
jgi:ribosome-associated protein